MRATVGTVAGPARVRVGEWVWGEGCGSGEGDGVPDQSECLPTMTVLSGWLAAQPAVRPEAN